MEYQEFLEYIRDNIIQMITEEKENEGGKTEASCKAVLHKVAKNNGIVLDALTLRREGEPITPNIYLNPYYESYQMGKPVSVIMEEIYGMYQETRDKGDFPVLDLTDYEAVKDKIVVRLVNYERNKKELENCPFIKYQDLAVVFRFLAQKNTVSIATSMVSNTEFHLWETGLDELYRTALSNTMREFPWKLDSLVHVIMEQMKPEYPGSMKGENGDSLPVPEEMEEKIGMYVLTNDAGINGAACMLYDDVIQNFAKEQNRNVYILPSSIHELILVPEQEDTDPEFLAELVVEANQTAVGLIDLLSDNIYYYDRDRDEISMYKAG